MIKRLKDRFLNNNYRCIQDWNINFSEVKKKINSGAILVDVRSIQEYNEDHLEGAIHLAEFDIPAKYNIVLPDKNKIIILYCQNGGRSKRAYKKLKKLGYKNIYNLCGGLDNLE